jgi:hypothetical protein
MSPLCISQVIRGACANSGNSAIKHKDAAEITSSNQLLATLQHGLCHDQLQCYSRYPAASVRRAVIASMHSLNAVTTHKSSGLLHVLN